MRKHACLFVMIVIIIAQHNYKLNSQVMKDFQVNENAGGGDQYSPAIAIHETKNFIVVWQDTRNGNSDIYAQLFKNDGTKLGDNFQINDESPQEQSRPRVAMDSEGDFVIVWRERYAGYYSIYGQFFTNNGEKIGTNFKITDDKYEHLWFISAAMDKNGKLVVVWDDDLNNNSNIRAQLYSSSGVKQGNNFLVNDDNTGRSQNDPDIAVDGNGNWVIVWQDSRNVNENIFAQRYNNEGIKLGDNFQVNDDAKSFWQLAPVVAMDNSGNFVISWNDNQDTGKIMAQRFNQDGKKLDSNFQINDDDDKRSVLDLDIAMDDNHNFVIVWWGTQNGEWTVYGQSCNLDGTKNGGNFNINDMTTDLYKNFSEVSSPSIEMDRKGNFIVGWQDNPNGTFDIFIQRYNYDLTKSTPNNKIDNDWGYGDQTNPVISANSNGDFIVVWLDKRNGYDIYAQRYTINGIKCEENFKINDERSTREPINPCTGIDQYGNFVVVWQDYRNGNYDIYAQWYDFNGQKKGANFRVNDDNGKSIQSLPTIGVNKNGNLIVAWADERNSSFQCDIYAQLFYNDASKQGGNFRVNNDEGRIVQGTPAVAMEDNGNFLIVWKDMRNGEYLIFAQLYSKDGTRTGDTFQVSDNLGVFWQTFTVVAMNNDGNFVIGWETFGRGFYLQLYNNTGTKLGSNFPTYDREDVSPASQVVSMEDNGNIIVVWSARRNWTFYDRDIYARYFNNQGKAIGKRYRVDNDSGNGEQLFPDVKLVNNYIYYTWQDNRIEGQGYDIFARVDRFNPTVVEEPNKNNIISSSFQLFQNFPNPFNPCTSIQYSLPKANQVSLKIYNISGQEVKTLVENQQEAGEHFVEWDGNLTDGEIASSGIYYCQLKVGNEVQVRKMVLAR